MSINQAAWEQTELLELNRAAGIHPVELSDESLQVLQTGITIGELTNGAFDVSIAPLVLLWMVTGSSPMVPAPEAIKEAQALIDFRKIEISGNQVYLPEPGMGIDLGGIAKGYAAGEAARILRQAGVNHAILDFGGDVVTVGTRPDGNPWRIGLQDPAQRRGSLMGIVQAEDISIVTSGVYERYFEQDGQIFHHIIDTETGYPTDNSLLSVTVVSKDPVVGDALSTGAFVMGLREGYELLEELDDVEGVFIDDQNRVYLTSGLQANFRLLGSDYVLSCTEDIGDCADEE
ncbi:FAD:protein FMN transferase [Spirochaeta dissipatitropha]